MSKKFPIPFLKCKPDSQVPSKDRSQTDLSRRKLPKLKRLILRQRSVTSPVEGFELITKSYARADKNKDSGENPKSLSESYPDVGTVKVTSTTDGVDGRISPLHNTSDSQDESCDKKSLNCTKEGRQLSRQLSISADQLYPLHESPLTIEADSWCRHLPTSTQALTRQRSITSPVNVFKPSVQSLLEDHSDEDRRRVTITKKGLPNSARARRRLRSLTSPVDTFKPLTQIKLEGQRDKSSLTRQRSITSPVNVFKPSVQSLLEDHSDEARRRVTITKKGLPNSARARRCLRSLTSPVDTFKPLTQSSIEGQCDKSSRSELPSARKHQCSLTSPVDTFKPLTQSSLEGQFQKSSRDGLPNPVLAKRPQRSVTSPVDGFDHFANAIPVRQTNQLPGQSKGNTSFSKKRFLTSAKLKRWQKYVTSAVKKLKSHHVSVSEVKDGESDTHMKQTPNSPQGSSTNENAITLPAEPVPPLLGEHPSRNESELELGDMLFDCDLTLDTGFADLLTPIKEESLSSKEDEKILEIARAELESHFNEHLEWSPRKLRLSRLWSTSGIHVPPADPTADIFNIQVYRLVCIQVLLQVHVVDTQILYHVDLINCGAPLLT